MSYQAHQRFQVPIPNEGGQPAAVQAAPRRVWRVLSKEPSEAGWMRKSCPDDVRTAWL